MTGIMGTLHEDVCTGMILHSVILRMRNVLDKICNKNRKTHFMFIYSFWKSCCLWDNVEKYGRARQVTDDSIIQCVHFACWIIKGTNTLLTAFPLQQ
jgi:hypothetical protein